MVPIGKESTDFVRACEAIHALLAKGLLAPDDRDLIEFSSRELLIKLRPSEHLHQISPSIGWRSVPVSH
jgi:hypothetical protein